MSAAERLDDTLLALADPTRRRVVELLRDEPRRAGELAAAFGMVPPAMSRHLRILRQSGLVEEESPAEDARVRLYRLRAEPFSELRGWLEELAAFWSDQLSAFKAHAEGLGTSALMEERSPGRRAPKRARKGVPRGGSR